MGPQKAWRHISATNNRTTSGIGNKPHKAPVSPPARITQTSHTLQNQTMNKLVFLLLVVLVSGCASRTPKLWDASSVANVQQPVVLFKDKPDGKIFSGVRTDDVRNMIGIKDRVENAAGPMRIELLVSDSEEPNGFSTQIHGKEIIGVTVGMINLIGQDADAMAALIGHELAHLYLEHGKQRQSREEDRVMASTLIGFALGMVGIPMGTADLATTAVSRSYSRDDERDADRVGVEYLSKAGFDPCGALRLHEKLAVASSGSMLVFLNTHPANAERVENMKKLAACG